MAQTYTVLGTTEHGVPSGNYDGSSQDWTSDPVQAADYYRGRGSSTQTVIFRLDSFVGRIVMEATLDSEAQDASWFEIYSIGDPVVPLTDYHPATIAGNFVWVRARVELFEDGVIQFVTISY
jgi:hypothetical protein